MAETKQEPKINGYVWKSKTISNKNIENVVSVFQTAATVQKARIILIQTILNKLKTGDVCLTKPGFGKPLEVSYVKDAEEKNLEYYEINTAFISHIMTVEPELLEDSKFNNKKLNAKAKPFVPRPPSPVKRNWNNYSPPMPLVYFNHGFIPIPNGYYW